MKKRNSGPADPLVDYPNGTEFFWEFGLTPSNTVLRSRKPSKFLTATLPIKGVQRHPLPMTYDEFYDLSAEMKLYGLMIMDISFKPADEPAADWEFYSTVPGSRRTDYLKDRSLGQELRRRLGLTEDEAKALLATSASDSTYGFYPEGKWPIAPAAEERNLRPARRAS